MSILCICFSELTKKEKEETALRLIKAKKKDLSAQKVCHSRQGHSEQTR